MSKQGKDEGRDDGTRDEGSRGERTDPAGAWDASPLDEDVARVHKGLRGRMLVVAGIVGGLLLLSAIGIVRTSAVKGPVSKTRDLGRASSR